MMLTQLHPELASFEVESKVKHDWQETHRNIWRIGYEQAVKERKESVAFRLRSLGEPNLSEDEVRRLVRQDIEANVE